MSVLDETIGSQRVDDEELVAAGDEKSSYATHITNSNVFLTKQGTTETKKNRRVAQQSSRKKGFPGGALQNYSTPDEQVSRKNNDPFFKTPGQNPRRDLMAETKVGVQNNNINQNISEVGGPSSTLSQSISKINSHVVTNADYTAENNLTQIAFAQAQIK